MFNLTILSHVDVLNEFHCFTFLSLTSFRVLIDKVRANVLTEGKFQTKHIVRPFVGLGIMFKFNEGLFQNAKRFLVQCIKLA